MIPRYSRPEMTAIWDPQTRFRIWFEIEAHAADAMAELGVVAGELEAEGGRLGMDAVAAADGRCELVLKRAALERGKETVEIFEKNIRGLRELHGEAGIEHVR